MFGIGNNGKERVTEVQEVWDQQQIQDLLDKTAKSEVNFNFTGKAEDNKDKK